MRKTLIVVPIVILVIMAQFIATVPVRKSLRAQLNPNYIRAMAAYKRLEPKMPREELRALTTIGILNGAVQAEKQMEQHLVEVVKDLLLNTDKSDADNLKPKIEKIEKQLVRDQRAIEILTSAMDLAMKNKNLNDFQLEMQQSMQQLHQDATTAKDPLKVGETVNATPNENMEQRVADLRKHILEHITLTKDLLDKKIENTLDYLIEEADENGILAKANKKVVRKRHADDSQREEPAEIRMIKSILTEDDFRDNLIDVGVEKRMDDINDSLEDDFDLDDLSKKVIASRVSTQPTTLILPKITLVTSTTKTPFSGPAKQEEGSPEVADSEKDNDMDAEPAPGGGLVGLIAGLSGGEGGSDVGALIGALTGLVSTLFGPGGLDIEALISTATSLISGLLSGNKNFGTVLGQYVGTAFDGLSGGGGAINNGQFIGNFLGTVVASLSADPEEDDAPPKPLIFAQNLLSSFMEAKNRKSSAEASDERKGDNNGGKPPAGGGGGGSDSSGFIKHIVSHLVNSAVGLILNASVGASGGASHASGSLFAGSSGGHNKPAGGKAW